MRRDLKSLEAGFFDLLVIGGGIIGLSAAREAASRGLSTALVEKDDFGAATSANSLKLIHGGLRYLQHADFRRMRQSIRERLAFMRMAPHLVHPLSFLVPTYGHTTKSREAMAVAFFVYGLVAYDRNRTGDPEKNISAGRVISAEECLGIFPGFKEEGLTGGAIFKDGQMYNSERLAIAVALAAADEGAVLANYARAVGFHRKGPRVTGARIRDGLSGKEFDVHAKVVLNAAGPWIDGLLGLLPEKPGGSGYLLAKAVNIVVPRLLCNGYAVGLESREESSDSLVKRGGRLFFVTPWRGSSIIGTTYNTYRDDPDRMRVTEADIMELVDGINSAWPGAGVTREEVSFYHAGLVPITAETGPDGANLAKADRLIDHEREDRIEGLISALGVKYTTARDVAEKAVNMAFEKLGTASPASMTARTPLPGGRIKRFGEFLEELAGSAARGLTPEIMRHLAYNYGSDYDTIISYGEENVKWLETVAGSREVLKGEILHGVRKEMAVKLSDSVMRRTDLGAIKYPGDECLKECAAVMAAELGWDAERVDAEIKETKAAFCPAG